MFSATKLHGAVMGGWRKEQYSPVLSCRPVAIGQREYSNKVILTMHILDEALRIGDKVSIFSQHLHTLDTMEVWSCIRALVPRCLMPVCVWP